MNKLNYQLNSSHLCIWDLHVQQQVFRAIMESMARPGQIQNIENLIYAETTYLAVLASLVDGEVSLHDKDQLLADQNWPLLQARKEVFEKADFILCNGLSTANGLEPKLGTLSSPDYSATLVISVKSIEKTAQGSNSTLSGDSEKPSDSAINLSLTGPGIETENKLSITGLNISWLEHREEWTSHFPLGVDMILADSSSLISLPRTTKLEVLSK